VLTNYTNAPHACWIIETGMRGAQVTAPCLDNRGGLPASAICKRGHNALKAEYEACFNRPVRSSRLWSLEMSRILLGTICGLVYGALSAASMIPLSFSDMTAALRGAFINPLRYRLRHWSGASARAVLGPGSYFRHLAEPTGCHHHQNLCANPCLRGHRWTHWAHCR
jgi:hypothetical protein